MTVSREAPPRAATRAPSPRPPQPPPLLVVVDQCACADEACVGAELCQGNLDKVPGSLHGVLLYDTQSGFHEHGSHLGNATSQDDHLGIEDVNDVDEAYAES